MSQTQKLSGGCFDSDDHPFGGIRCWFLERRNLHTCSVWLEKWEGIVLKNKGTRFSNINSFSLGRKLVNHPSSYQMCQIFSVGQTFSNELNWSLATQQLTHPCQSQNKPHHHHQSLPASGHITSPQSQRFCFFVWWPCHDFCSVDPQRAKRGAPVLSVQFFMAIQRRTAIVSVHSWEP